MIRKAHTNKAGNQYRYVENTHDGFHVDEEARQWQYWRDVAIAQRGYGDKAEVGCVGKVFQPACLRQAVERVRDGLGDKHV